MSPQTKTVSVVIPARDAAATIQACVASIFAQDWPSALLDVLVVDNGSRDQTAELARRAGARVVLEPKRGRSAARNRGVRETKGELLSFIDSDSTAPPDWLTRCARSLRHAWVGASQPLVQKTGQGHESVSKRFVQAHYYLPFLATCGLVTTRAAFDAVRGFDEDLQRGVDMDFSFRLLASGYALAWETDATVFAAHDMGHRQVLHRGWVRGGATALLSKKWRGLENVAPTARWLDRGKGWVSAALTDLRSPLISRGLGVTEATSKLIATIVGDLKHQNVEPSHFESRTRLPAVLGERRYLLLTPDGAVVFDQARRMVIELTVQETSLLEYLVDNGVERSTVATLWPGIRARDEAVRVTEALRSKLGIPRIERSAP